MRNRNDFFRTKEAQSKKEKISLSDNNNQTSYKQKWHSINKEALKRLLPNAPIIHSEIDLSKATFNEAIQLLNRMAGKEKCLSLTDLEHILKKFQQKDMGEKEEEAVFLYEYIITTFGQSENKADSDINEIHRQMMEFYISHRTHFNKKGEAYAIKKVENIFEQYSSNNTFTALIHAYQETKLYEKAWNLYHKHADTYRCGYLYDHYFKVLFSLPESVAKDNKTGLERVKEHYETIKLLYFNTLNPHSYRSILELYRDCLKNKKLITIHAQNRIISNNNNETQEENYEFDLNNNNNVQTATDLVEATEELKDKKGKLLDEVKKIYDEIPEEMKVDQVCRVMLNIILKHEGIDEAEQHFKCMQTSRNVTLTDMSYQRMMEAYFDKGRYQDAEDLLNCAFETNNLLINKPNLDLKKNRAELDLHEIGTTGGGKSFYGGKSEWFNSLAIHYLLRCIKDSYSNCTTYKVMSIKIICGGGSGVVRNSVEEILRSYDLHPNQDGNNAGCLIFSISVPKLQQGCYQDFFVPSKLAKSMVSGSNPTEPKDSKEEEQTASFANLSPSFSNKEE